MCLSFLKLRKSICKTCMLCLSVSESITWNSSQVNAIFFHNDINYLAHHVSKEGVLPSKENMTAVAEFATPQTCTKIQTFLALVGHYWQFIKGFAWVWHSHYMNTYLEKKLARRVSEKYSLAMCRLPLRWLRYHVLRFLCWLLLTLTSHSLGNWCWQVRIGGSVIAETVWWVIPPCCIC